MGGVITIGRGIKLPIFAILRAIPKAAARCRESAADNRDADSPGGAKTTASEVTEDVIAFMSTLAEEAMPAILRANGIAA